MPDADALQLDFDQRVTALEHLCCLESDWQQLLREGSLLVDALQHGFKTGLASQTVPWDDQQLDQQLDQRALTEIHRLLRLLQTDIAFCRAAQTFERQQQRRQTLQTHAQQLSAHWQTVYSG